MLLSMRLASHKSNLLKYSLPFSQRLDDSCAFSGKPESAHLADSCVEMVRNFMRTPLGIVGSAPNIPAVVIQENERRNNGIAKNIYAAQEAHLSCTPDTCGHG